MIRSEDLKCRTDQKDPSCRAKGAQDKKHIVDGGSGRAKGICQKKGGLLQAFLGSTHSFKEGLLAATL